MSQLSIARKEKRKSCKFKKENDIIGILCNYPYADLHWLRVQFTGVYIK